MAKTASIPLIILCVVLCSCGGSTSPASSMEGTDEPHPSSSHPATSVIEPSSLPSSESETSDFSDASWYQSILSVHSYTQESDLRSYPTPVSYQGDGFYSGTELPDASAFAPHLGDVYLNDLGGGAIYIGEEGIADGKVVPDPKAYYRDGWYIVYQTSSGYYRFRPQDPSGYGDLLQKAFYRSIFSPNAHCEYFMTQNDDWTLEGRVDVSIGTVSSVSTTVSNGDSSHRGDYFWVEDGEPYSYYDGRYFEENAADIWRRFAYQVNSRSLNGFVSVLGPLVESFGLFEKKEGRYLLCIDRAYKDPGSHSTFYYEITLDEASKYVETLRVYCESYQGDGSFETVGSDFRFRDFGTTQACIPEEIVEGAKEIGKKSSQSDDWRSLSWSRR